MRVGLASEGMNEAHFIGQGSEMWNQFRYHLSTLTPSFEFPGTLGKITLLSLKSDKLIASRHWFPMKPYEFRLVIKSVDLANCSRAKNLQYLSRTRFKMRITRSVRITGIN